ncbi:sugar ABC transporter ATP-binding protein [Gracilibacillus kekensis]|uniref:Ribose/galactose/methyl galactoside import ATP-binding protein n=1 Tax=Gracilibacillus kekensis TaxID=1027249 RepID=A0A1M7QVI9_9BACI|nr:sugar ABC transporter ATP-binding protein [Gracilibacillus kekensis]SHN35876.1 monosaccharide ABC transporter ATP-binding protein, CUT2 family [Gracilibacillus kekensis]
MPQSILKMKNITIDFPGVRALDDAQFLMHTGQVHALIGANGAGKSTLMKVLSGAYTHYTGDIILNDKKIEIRSPQDAKELGIQIVYQEVDTALIPYLTVGENIMLNKMVNGMGKRQFIQYSQIHKEASSLLERLNIHVSSRRLVRTLTLAEKQMVLIARAISRDCRYLILDEPTAPLSNTETDQLFEIVRQLRSSNVGVIFISHRLQELFEICDEITVMRNGNFISHNQINEVTIDSVVEKMLGKQMEEQFPTMEREVKEKVFEVKHLRDDEKVEDVSFHVCAGEVIGLAGLVGAGKTEICKALFGESSHLEGIVKMHGKTLNIRNSNQAVNYGIALVPEERRKEGVLVEEKVSTNLTSAHLSSFVRRFSFLNFKKERTVSAEMVEKLGVKTPSIETKLSNLSGGNQQKIAIGKWLIADADVYIFDEPTKGVDVGSKKDIFTLILELAKRGKSIIYASSELTEIVGITDRSYVIYDGKVVKELQTNKTTEEQLLFYSTGGRDS